MRRVYGDELKKIQLDILAVVADFCDKNGISYWIDCGTLLGAIRHRGYIPWDDDIDVGMLRPDYDRFMQLFNSENERYKFFSIENNENFYYAHGKVLDTTTVLYEPDIRGNKLSINIDIFVYDNAPNDDKKVEAMYNKRDFFRALHVQRNSNYTPRGSFFRRSCVYILRYVLKPFPKNYFIKRLLSNSKKHVHDETARVGNFTSYSRMVCDKSVFKSFITAEFEGRYYKIPIGYDAWLRAFYNDYMVLPPEDKRVSHHQFEAYVQDDEREKYESFNIRCV